MVARGMAVQKRMGASLRAPGDLYTDDLADRQVQLCPKGEVAGHPHSV